MRKILFGIALSTCLISSAGFVQNTAAQTVIKSEKNQNDGEKTFYSSGFLKSDRKQADVVAYVNIKERTLIDALGEDKANCENGKGSGTCLYLLKADVKETFKGGKISGKIEFLMSLDAGYSKDKLMGERVVFLNRKSNAETGEMKLVAIENSTRWIKYEVLAKLRKLPKKS